MNWTGLAHLLESFSEGAPPTMKPHVDVIQRHPEARGQSVSRLAQDVGAPNNIGILCLESR